MSNMSRNNSSTSLMGFSVHQPAIGAPLQFFPAMGSKQLDEMIHAYVPGDDSISDKRAKVSLEFFEHTLATGELFKFFMVYPSLGSITESPTNSMVDLGYASNFTSPVMPEDQWSQSGNVSPSSSDSQTRKSSFKKAAALSADFSHLPGMKILTRDGRDVTNSASRGCKTKEQRDHAHLMRIIKACDSCRKKKVRCDPSHKRSAGSSGIKTTKKAKKTASPSVPPPPQPAPEPSLYTSFDATPDLALSSSSFDSIMPESLIDPAMDWDQFVQYEGLTEAIPYDYDFFFDPAGYLSPTSSNSFSPSQPITPAQIIGIEGTGAGATDGEAQALLPPYLNPGGEGGTNYADFNLYSPGSSTYLDDDPSLTKEVAAARQPDYSEYIDHQRLCNNYGPETLTGQDGAFNHQPFTATTADHQASLAQEETHSPADIDSLSYRGRFYGGSGQVSNISRSKSNQSTPVSEIPVPTSRDGLGQSPLTEMGEPQYRQRASTSPTGLDAPLYDSQGSQASSGVNSRFKPTLTNPRSQYAAATAVDTTHTSSGRAYTGLTAPGTLVSAISSTGSVANGFRNASIIPQRQTSALRLTLLEDLSMNGASLPQSYSSWLFRTPVEMRCSSASIADPVIQHIPMRAIIAPDTTAFQTITIVNAMKMAGTLGVICLSASLSKAIDGGLRSDTVFSALTIAVFYTLPWLFVLRTGFQEASTRRGGFSPEPEARGWPKIALPTAYLLALVLLGGSVVGALRRWQMPGNISEGLDIALNFSRVFSVSAAYITLREKIIPRVVMKSLSTQHLSSPRLTVMSTNNLELGYSRLSRGLSKIRCTLERKTSLKPSGGVGQWSFRLVRTP